jgi:hypothetical protein
LRFEYQGSPENWAPPAGASNVTFELYGASGGGGAKGGAVTGRFIETPEQLTIYVGGRGQLGSGASGGFNGGGRSGFGAESSGSGGGASDLRIGMELLDRVAVAGGAGGSPRGYANGGAEGGGLSAADARAEFGQGGAGGTQDSGGAAGLVDGIFESGTAGGFGQGGDGGSAESVGSAGGGGGWFGGGGGGGWANPNYSFDFHAAGGGGGSSYVNQDLITDVTHTPGARDGDGLVIIRYTLKPSISNLALEQVDANTVLLSFSSEGSLVSLLEQELLLSDPSCVFAGSYVESGRVLTTLLGCSHGALEVEVVSSNYSPVTQIATVFVDREGPEFEFLSGNSASSLSDLVVPFTHSDSVSMSSASFIVSGCESTEVAASSLRLAGCLDGNVLVTVLERSLRDEFGNLGPEQTKDVLFSIDSTPPTASWSQPVVTGSGPYLMSFQLEFSEPVIMELQAVHLSSTSTCEHEAALLPSLIAFQATCIDPQITAELLGDVTDLLGNPLEASPGVLRVDPQPAPVSSESAVISESPAITASEVTQVEGGQVQESTPSPSTPNPPAAVPTSPPPATESASAESTTSESVKGSSTAATESQSISTTSSPADAGVEERESAVSDDSNDLQSSSSQHVSIAVENPVDIVINLDSLGPDQTASFPTLSLASATMPQALPPQVIRVEYPVSVQREEFKPENFLVRNEPVQAVQTITEEKIPWPYLFGLLAVAIVGIIGLRFSGR